MDIIKIFEINGYTANYLEKYEFMDSLPVFITIVNFTRERTSTSL